MSLTKNFQINNIQKNTSTNYELLNNKNEIINNNIIIKTNNHNSKNNNIRIINNNIYKNKEIFNNNNVQIKNNALMKSSDIILIKNNINNDKSNINNSNDNNKKIIYNTNRSISKENNNRSIRKEHNNRSISKEPKNKSISKEHSNRSISKEHKNKRISEEHKTENDYSKIQNFNNSTMKNNQENNNQNSKNTFIVSPTKDIGNTTVIIIKQSSKERRMKYLRGKSQLSEEKKECLICHKYIETHLIKIHFNSHSSKIFNWMFLGTFSNACDIEELRRIGVNYVLNCAAECQNTHLPDDIIELHLNIRDEKKFDLSPFFEESNKFINKAKMSGGALLIHCKYGISRSVSLIIAYLIKYLGFSVVRALNFLRNIKQQINPNEGFLEQLSEYEKNIKIKEKK